MKTIPQVMAAAASVEIDVYSVSLHENTIKACVASDGVSYNSLKRLTELLDTTKIDIYSELDFPGSQCTPATSELILRIRW